MQKTERQNILTALIAESKIANQSELVSQLREQGFKVTQASISRDLDELGIVKRAGVYSLSKRVPADAGFGAVSFDTAGDNLIVGRCASGLASAVTVTIDAAGIAEIVGTIAGDDTIFIAVKGQADQTLALAKIRATLG